EAPEGRLGTVDPVQLSDEAVQPLVYRLVEYPPVQATLLAPLGGLAELLAHEQQLFARVPPHECEVGAHIGELLPLVTRHLAEQRALAVHDFVVADRGDEIL